ncbi:MAG: response regulator transcription factor [Bacteroidota bacterium]
MKVLICEGEEVLLTAIEFRLRKQGYKVELAANIEETLEKIETEKPNLLIVDIESSRANGLELIKKVRAEKDGNVPIIIIADLENEDGVIEGYENGVKDFVTKPFKPVELVLRARLLLGE